MVSITAGRPLGPGTLEKVGLNPRPLPPTPTLKDPLTEPLRGSLKGSLKETLMHQTLKTLNPTTEIYGNRSTLMDFMGLGAP